MAHRQTGAGGLLIAVILLLLAAAALAAFVLLKSKGQGDRSGQDAQRFETIKAALVQFTAANGRLPCPASPAADTGAADPDAASVTCNFLQGTVPWKTIGIRRDDAIDAWGWKISYRVYARSLDGTIPASAGSLTQAGGASLVNCDTSQALSAGRTQVSAGIGGLCRAAKDTLDTEFAVGKGLTITWFGTAITDAAYVVVSHGPSGLGAYTSGATPVQKALPASASELANLSPAGPFVAATRSAASIASSDAAHFDDMVAYQTLRDLVRLAGLGARDWAETTGFSDVTLNAATVGAALEGTATTGDLGQTTLNVSNARLTGLVSGGTQNLAFDATADAIGTASGGNNMSSSLGEGVRVEFDTKATQLAVTLGHFGATSSFGVWRERAQLNFYNGDIQVHTEILRGCHGGNGLASFTIDLGGTEYDKVEIFPIVSTAHPSFGTTLTSNFYLAAFKSCTAGTCRTSLYDSANSCPLVG